MTIIDVEDLAKFAGENDEAYDILDSFGRKGEEPLSVHLVAMWNTSTKLHEQFEEWGLKYFEGDDGAGWKIESLDALKKCQELCQTIMDEYEDPNLEWDQKPTWNKYNLGGDDDVDYCGSQPDGFIDILTLYLLR